MTNTDAFALARSDLNSFVFADIGTEASGMTLSVLSALSRLDMDPWQEAARLASLPRAAAVDVLAGIVAAMPGSLWPQPAARRIAARLVALLPAPGAAAPAAARTAARKWRQGLLMLALLATGVVGLTLNLVGERAAASATPPAAATTQTAPVATPSLGRVPAKHLAAPVHRHE